MFSERLRLEKYSRKQQRKTTNLTSNVDLPMHRRVYTCTLHRHAPHIHKWRSAKAKDSDNQLCNVPRASSPVLYLRRSRKDLELECVSQRSHNKAFQTGWHKITGIYSPMVLFPPPLCPQYLRGNPGPWAYEATPTVLKTEHTKSRSSVMVNLGCWHTQEEGPRWGIALIGLAGMSASIFLIANCRWAQYTVGGTIHR